MALSVSIPTNSVMGFFSPCPLQQFKACRFLDYGHSDWCEVIPHCSFDFSIKWCWATFHVLICHPFFPWFWLKVYQFIFSENQLLVLLIFATVFFVSTSFISAGSLWFLLTLLLQFSGCFRYKVILFWDFSCFLRWHWIAISFPLRTAFAVSHRLWVIMFSFTCFYFLFPLWFVQ